MLRKDAEKLMLDISSNQRDHDAAHQAFIILKEAIKSEPEMMKSYWDKIASYLYRKNVSVRVRATLLLGDLIPYVDHEQFDAIFNTLLRQMESDSVVVASTFASIIPQIIKSKPDFEERIMKRILDTDKIKHKNRHWQIIKNSIVEAMDQYMDYSLKDDRVIDFIKGASQSSSPKTKKTAKRILKKRNIITE